MTASPKIKICGLSTREAIDAVADAGADFAGFIFFERSPRNITPAQSVPLGEAARSRGLRTVAVTVDAGDGLLDAITAALKPDWLQLHGSEDADRVAEVKARYGLPVIRALAISEPGDLARLTPFKGIADKFLLDAKPPKGAGRPGGNAVRFDWSILDALPAGTDYLLAGGIDADNVGQALAVGAPGLDISSGVESAPGVKEPEKIRAFFEALERAT